MGLPVERENFDEEDYAHFAERLGESLTALRALLARPGFGEGQATIGAEVEMHLVDAQAAPTPKNAEVLQRLSDPRVTLEINRFNLEINAAKATLAGTPFRQLHAELAAILSDVRDASSQEDARVALVGILPTLRIGHLMADALSDAPRYRALSRILQVMRGAPFAVHIKGRESHTASCDDVTLEGANASFQVHLRVCPAAFARHFNAAQLAAAPVLAASANSPYFDGCELWDETRIALFQQSVDTRLDARERARMPSRVSFGHGWLREAHDPFTENVALHAALLPVLTDERALAVVRDGGVPSLSELRLHQSTVWSWNRAIYDPHDGGHLRIEHRVLPSGPTLIDMIANAALTLGLTLGLAPMMDELTPTLPFSHVEQNFYRAAKHGLAAELAWPASQAPSPRVRRADELVLGLLPLAAHGLTMAGVDAGEVDDLLAIVRGRVTSGRTGAVVQRAMVAQVAREQACERERALAKMMDRYLAWSERDIPVHRWDVPLTPESV
jgi:gamma-glutamyl:cysteine ligase YbdK (ATP-grasp superfamily)